MNDNAAAYKTVIGDMQKKIAEDEKALSVRKRMVNDLAVSAGMAPIYASVEVERNNSVSLSIKSDQFYGQPQATCVKTILQMRKALDQGPATVAEIYSALLEGGFAFETNNEENRKRGLRISITKNTALFHKLPNGKIGLLEWYPKARKRKAGAAADSTERDDEFIEQPSADAGDDDDGLDDDETPEDDDS